MGDVQLNNPLKLPVQVSPDADEAIRRDWGEANLMGGGGGGVTDHGALTGLADDDHAQYHTDARGDARYVNETDHDKAAHDALNIDADTLDGTDSSGFAASAHNHDATYVNEGDFTAAAVVGKFTGTPDGTQFLRDDGALAAVSGGAIGYMPYAYPIGGGPALVTTNSAALPINGGAIAMSVVLEGHMLLESVSYWDLNAALARGPAEFALYVDRLNNANALDLVSGAVGTLAAYTPSAASLKTIDVTSAPVYLAPGSYWLVIINNGATNALNIGVSAVGTMAANAAQTKTLSAAAFGSTLDFVAATWTKIGNVPSPRLNGRAFGQTTSF